nr:Zn-finger in Ran binding protein [Haemonchus contortus]
MCSINFVLGSTHPELVPTSTGYGGGFNDRQDIEYIRRDTEDEFDEFGRKRKKKDDQNAAPANQATETKIIDDAMDDEDEEEEGEIDKYKLGSDAEEEEESDDDEVDEAVLEKYDLTADPEIAEIKIEIKRPPPRPADVESE